MKRSRDRPMWFLFHFSRQKLIALITLLTLHFTDCFDTETCGMYCQQPSTAVVVYDESKLSPLVKTSRIFNFANTELVIKQDWGNLGVAAVVWDAVSYSHDKRLYIFLICQTE